MQFESYPVYRQPPTLTSLRPVTDINHFGSLGGGLMGGVLVGGLRKKNRDKNYCVGVKKNSWISFLGSWAIQNGVSYSIAMNDPQARSEYYRQQHGVSAPAVVRRSKVSCSYPAYVRSGVVNLGPEGKRGPTYALTPLATIASSKKRGRSEEEVEGKQESKARQRVTLETTGNRKRGRSQEEKNERKAQRIRAEFGIPGL